MPRRVLDSAAVVSAESRWIRYPPGSSWIVVSAWKVHADRFHRGGDGPLHRSRKRSGRCQTAGRNGDAGNAAQHDRLPPRARATRTRTGLNHAAQVGLGHVNRRRHQERSPHVVEQAAQLGRDIDVRLAVVNVETHHPAIAARFAGDTAYG